VAIKTIRRLRASTIVAPAGMSTEWTAVVLPGSTFLPSEIAVGNEGTVLPSEEMEADMASEQLQRLAGLFASVRGRTMHNPGLEDIRDICERVQIASAEPAGVRYVEVDADGVPALWCIPEECDATGVSAAQPRRRQCGVLDAHRTSRGMAVPPRITPLTKEREDD
jgi:hypothetical protein